MLVRVMTNPEPMVWPDVPRICFAGGEPWELNACVGSPLSESDDMTAYLAGYRDAAETIYAAALTSHRSPDVLVFPLAFLWRHHLELALKDIIATGMKLGGRRPEVPLHHKLPDLWAKAKPFIAACGDPNAPELVHVNPTRGTNMDSSLFDRFATALLSLPDDDMPDALERAEDTFNRAVRDHGMAAVFPTHAESGRPVDRVLGLFEGRTLAEVSGVMRRLRDKLADELVRRGAPADGVREIREGGPRI
jgi:hypothetical protein